jgi:hypothetical protein
MTQVESKYNVTLLMVMILGILVIGSLFLTYGYEKTYGLWNVPTMRPHFADLRVITSASETYAQGIDPLIMNPSDQLQRPLNYPRIWQSLFKIGVDVNHTTGIGVSLILLFFIGNYLFLQKSGAIAVVFVMLALFSPAVLLGIERANIDLLMFFILSTAIVLANKSYGYSLCLVLFAFILKLYPIFGLTVLLRKDKLTIYKIVLLVIVTVGLYVIITYNDLALISRATPRSIVLSYGIDVFWMKMSSYNHIAGIIYKGLSYILLVLVIGKAFTDSENTAKYLSISNDCDYCFDAFRVGGAVYIGTFLIGNNWDYRLMFLLFVIPQLIKWSRSDVKKIAVLSIVTIIGVYASLWYLLIQRVLQHFSFGHTLSYSIKEMSNWFIFCSLMYFIICTIPEWVRKYSRRFSANIALFFSGR